jgi:hypothetical protein
MRIPSLVRTVFLLAAACGCLCAQHRLSVVVYNYAGAPDGVVAQAVTTARMAFRSAGIDTQWTACRATTGWPENCPLPESGHYLELMIMRHAIAPPPGQAARHDIAGYALTDSDLPRPRAYAFYSITEGVAQRTMRPVGDALGCVLAHEAAHLLGLRHQAHGVMRETLDREGIDDTSIGRAFTMGDLDRLRAGVLHAGTATLSATR